jgi:hypothetical protein
MLRCVYCKLPTFVATDCLTLEEGTDRVIPKVGNYQPAVRNILEENPRRGMNYRLFIIKTITLLL